MKTALYDRHCALGGKMVDFSGWQMPLQYKGIVHEHLVVRNKVGLFDVSHMGIISIEGPESEALLDFLSTSQIAGKQIGTATYTVWCDSSGMCVDDLIIYRLDVDRFFLVANAANRKKDLDHLRFWAIGKNVSIVDHYTERGILAVQGQRAIPLIAKKFDVSLLKHMHFSCFNEKGMDLVIAHAGYTGAGGVEIYAANALIEDLWDWLLKEGKEEGIEPIGLGARDTLRLEMGYALYGHEISEHIAPIESVANWTIKWEKRDFLGKQAMLDLAQHSNKRREYGIILEGQKIARQGFPIFKDKHLIGIVTSGNFSPSLNQPIAIVLVERNLEVGDSVEVQIRGGLCEAKVVNLPFYTKKLS